METMRLLKECAERIEYDYGPDDGLLYELKQAIRALEKAQRGTKDIAIQVDTIDRA